MTKGQQSFELLEPYMDEDQHLDWVSRMAVLKSEYNFIPTTSQERNRAFGAIPFLDEAGGVGRHLNEVLIHQRKYVIDDPSRAVRNIVRGMRSYQSDAIRRRSSLLESYNILKYNNPKINVRDADTIPLLGLLSIVQHQEILDGIKNGDSRPIQGGFIKPKGEAVKRLVTAYDVETHSAPKMKELLFDRLSDDTVFGAREVIVEAGRSHASRSKFWGNILESSKSHILASRMLKEATES